MRLVGVVPVGACVFAIVASVLLTRAGNRSVAQNAALAVLVTGLVGFGLVGLGALLMRSAFPP